MSEATSSSSTLIFLPTVETSMPVTILGTTVKLNDSNYLLWAQAYHIFIGAQNKLTHLLKLPPAATDPTYVTWFTGNYFVMICLLNNLEENISGSVIFLTTAKEMLETMKVMYENEKNLSRVFEIYERMFELKHRDRYMPDFYE